MPDVSEVSVPSWAAAARSLFRVLVGVFGAVWITQLVVCSIVDLDLQDVPVWTGLLVVGYLLVTVVAGLVWLVGAVVDGYRGR